LDVPQDYNENRYYCVDYLGNRKHRIDYKYFKYLPGYAKVSDNRLRLINGTGSIIPLKNLSELSLSDVRSGKCLIVDMGGECSEYEREAVIMRAEEMYHDVNCLFWIKVIILCRYPQDIEKIKSEYPAQYKFITEKDEKPRVYEVLDEAPREGKLGDMEIAVRYYDDKQYGCMDKGLFQFSFSENRYVTDFGPGGRYIRAGGGYSGTLLAYGGKLYMTAYKCEKKARYKKDLYAVYNFFCFASVGDLLERKTDDDDWHSDLSGVKRQMGNIYKYLVLRGAIEPVDINEDAFFELEHMKWQEKPEAEDCPLLK
jgi:hypothetical protein